MRWQKLLFCLLAGAAASLCLPPISLLLAILFLSYPALQLAEAKSRRDALLIAGAAGMGWFTASTHWIAHSLLVGDADFWFLVPLVAMGVPAMLAVFWLVAGAVAWQIGKTVTGRLIWFVAILSFAEFARGHVATGFPWNAPGYLFSANLWLLQSASWFGLYGLTVLALCFAVTPALWRLGLRRWAVFFVILPFVLGGFGGVRLFLNPPAGTQGAKKIRLVQPAIPQAEKWDRAKRAQNFKHIVRISASQKPIPQLTIWPETAFSAFASRDGSLLKAMAMQTLPFDGVLITGLPRLDEDNRQFNSAALINPRGEIKSIYDKQRLVPFGEFAPFRRFLPFVDVIAGPTDFTAGTGNRLFDVPGYGKVRVLICYESIFSGDIVKGGTRPDLIVNITNDAWFGRTLGPWQHLAQARMRSVEEGVPVMRVANTGISAGFDAYGRSLGHIGLEKADVIDFAVPAPAPITFFARANHSSLFLGVLLLGLLARRLDQTKLMGH